ncbi:MAG: SRPBCC family protein [Candidatus Limnocylindria bacterium]
MAIEAQASTTIQRPTEAVFAYVSRLENLPEWQPSTVDVRANGSGVAVGTKAKAHFHVAGRNWASDLEVSEYEAGRRIGYRAKSPVPGHYVIALEPEGDATAVSTSFTMEAGGFFRFAEPLLKGSLRRDIEGDLANLKDILEAADGPE